ncbi:MAG: FG-GAP-like repeat-containing protein [Candidatus Acidiferrales bacterium]
MKQGSPESCGGNSLQPNPAGRIRRTKSLASRRRVGLLMAPSRIILARLGMALLAAASALFLAAPAMSQGPPPPPMFNNAPTITLPPACSPGNAPFTLGDTANRGKQDLVLICGSNIDTFLGGGNGTFGYPPVTTAINGTNPNGILLVGFQISLADMNGDGKLDLVTADADCNVNVFLGNGDGTFQTVPNQIPEGSGAPGIFCGFAAEPFVVGNFSGTGKNDIVLENNFGTNHSLTVLLNTTNMGKCSPGLVCFSQNFPTVASSAQTVTGLAAGNFNGQAAAQNTQDLAVAISPKAAGGNTNTIEVWNNNGQGTFVLQSAIVLPQTPNTGPLNGIAVADFNGDGNPDVAAEDSADGAIFILYGDGHGNLSSCSPSGTPASITSCQTSAGPMAGQTITGLPIYPSRAFLTANFNGFPGLLFSNTNNGMTVLLDSAGGILQTTGSNYVAGENPTAAVSGDLNNDGFPDVILAALPPRGGYLSVFLNNTAGILEGTQAFAAGTAPSQISLLQNFFGNGEQDVAVAQGGGDTVTVLGAPASGPNGTLPQIFGPIPAPAGAGNITALTSGCLDNSNPCAIPFVAFATFNSTTNVAAAYIITGGVSGPSSPTLISNAGLSSQPPVTAMAAGDFNCDGKTDLAFAIGNGSEVLVFSGNGAGTFNSPPLSIFVGLGADPVALAVADFNGDGLPDIAVLNQGNNEVGILINNANASACPAAPLSFATLAGYPTGLTQPIGMTVGDFNNDGKPDIAVASPFGLNPSAIAILLNQGGGVFPNTAGATIPLSFLIGPIATADFNGDGNLDLAVPIGFDFDTVQILTGDGKGNFATTNPPTFAAGLNPTSLVVADFNGDGKPDIAVADGVSASSGGSGNMVAVLLNEVPGIGYPEIGFMPPSIGFGSVAVGSPAMQPFTVTNTGGPNLLFGITPFSTTTPLSVPFTFDASTCPAAPSGSPAGLTYSLTTPGQFCTVNATFTPTAAGANSGGLTFLDNSPSGAQSAQNPGLFTHTYALTGTGTAGTNLTVTLPGSPTQGFVGSQLTYTVNVMNGSPSSETNVIVAFVFTPAVTFDSLAGLNPPCTGEPPTGNTPTTTFQCNIGTLSSQASESLTLVVTPNTAGQLTLTVNVSDSESDSSQSSATTTITGYAMVNDPETIHVTDTPTAIVAAQVMDPETITVTDTPGAMPAAQVMDPETITITDTPGAMPAAQVIDPETITVTDTPKAVIAPALLTLTTITGANSNDQGIILPADFTLVGNTAPVTVAFTVQGPTGGPIVIPTGTVTITDSNSTPDTCSAQLTNGVGSCPLVILGSGPGSTTLSATFTPDANSPQLLSSTSSPNTLQVVQIINCGIQPPPQTLGTGGTTTFVSITCIAGDVLNLPGFMNNPTIMVTGCPPNTLCVPTLMQNLTLNGVYSGVVTVTLGGNGSSVPLQDRRPLGEHWRLLLFGFGALLAMLTALQLARQKRARPRLLYVAGFLIAVVLSGISGCNNSSNIGGNRTPAGTYTINVTVSAGSNRVTVPLTLTVTQ